MENENIPDFLKPINPQEALKKFTTNLTLLAKQGKIDPIIGREQEIRRVMEILSRRTKNNPVLIGDPGVGKTAIVEGLAQRIIEGLVPSTLRDKEVVVLDFAALLAGAKFKGEFEERLKGVIKAIEESDGRYIIFIDEIHTLVGGGSSDGAMDAANMLKPSLARGSLRMIGATTVGEYRKYIEKDPALARRFQPVLVEEPSFDDAVSILRGIKEKYEIHHGIRITDNAILASVKLSTQYISNRFLPDKAIDLIDEAAASIKIESESMPTELDALKRKIMQYEIEIASLKKEKNDESKNKRSKLEGEILELQKNAKQIEEKWLFQKDIIKAIQEIKSKIDSHRTELEQAEREVDLQRAAEIKYGKIPELEKKLQQKQEEWKKIPEESRILREEVDDNDIAIVVSRWTGIPSARMLSTEIEKISNLEEGLKNRVIGQDEAVEVIARAIKRNRSGLGDKNKPIGSFLFLGPTGVGKTETAKALAGILFDDEKSIIRIDMSEYLEEHSVSRLIGAPPGYIGYEEGGQLTEAARRKPYSVILFDEIEKAHPHVFNIFLQLLDEGRLTDGKGNIVDFKNTIIIMTSNIGSEIINQYQQDESKVKKEDMQNQIMDLLHRKFRPEFLNRLDSVVIYNILSLKNVVEIARQQLNDVAERMIEKNIELKINDDLVMFFAEIGYDPIFGARPLRRAIESKLVDEMAERIISGEIKNHTKISPKIVNNKIVI